MPSKWKGAAHAAVFVKRARKNAEDNQGSVQSTEFVKTQPGDYKSNNTLAASILGRSNTDKRTRRAMAESLSSSRRMRRLSQESTRSYRSILSSTLSGSIKGRYSKLGPKGKNDGPRYSPYAVRLNAYRNSKKTIKRRGPPGYLYNKVHYDIPRLTESFYMRNSTSAQSLSMALGNKFTMGEMVSQDVKNTGTLRQGKSVTYSVNNTYFSPPKTLSFSTNSILTSERDPDEITNYSDNSVADSTKRVPPAQYQSVVDSIRDNATLKEKGIADNPPNPVDSSHFAYSVYSSSSILGNNNYPYEKERYDTQSIAGEKVKKKSFWSIDKLAIIAGVVILVLIFIVVIVVRSGSESEAQSNADSPTPPLTTNTTTISPTSS